MDQTLCPHTVLLKVDLGPKLRPDEPPAYKCEQCGKLWTAKDLVITVQRGRQPK